MIGWLYWDPSSDVVVLPLLGMPVSWYGLLFAIGFWLGFHIFSYMFARFLANSPEFNDGDIDWNKWRSKKPKELAALQDQSIASCNALLLEDRLDREDLNKSDKRLLAYASQRWSDVNLTHLRRRLLLENKYPEIFIPIRDRAREVGEKLILYVILATIVGARLAFICFYQNPLDYLMDPISILKTWEGGLASHGGVSAILIALYLFHKKMKKQIKGFSFWDLLDHVAIPTMLVASFIRIGNFINQEILGVPTTLPWAIIFGHPKDGSFPEPRHPAQLYESFFYFLIFITVSYLWMRHGKKVSSGRLAGIAIAGSFGFRFCIEFLKTNQTGWFDPTASNLLMGQLLSIPLVAIGLFLIFRSKPVKRKDREPQRN